MPLAVQLFRGVLTLETAYHMAVAREDLDKWVSEKEAFVAPVDPEIVVTHRGVCLLLFFFCLCQSSELLQDLHWALWDISGDHSQESRSGNWRPENAWAAADLCGASPVRGTTTKQSHGDYHSPSVCHILHDRWSVNYEVIIGANTAPLCYSGCYS